MAKVRKKPLPTLLVLLAHGFDALFVTEMTTLARRAGQTVSLVGLTAGPLVSDNGLKFCPDRMLEQVPVEENAVILFPGGKACVTALLRDPRILRFCQEARRHHGGQVVTVPSMQPLLENAGLHVTEYPEGFLGGGEEKRLENEFSIT